MKKIVILGSGAHAAEIERYVFENNQHSKEKINVVGYYDDNKGNWSKYKLKHPFLGGIRDYIPQDEIGVLIGIANISVRKELIAFYLEKGARFANFIHHTAVIFDTAQIGVGNVICKNCIVGPNAKLGNYNTLNTNASIAHDSVVGDNNVLCPNVGFSGSTQVKDNNFFSLNSTTIPNVVIGSDNIIAPNMVIEKTIKDNSTVFYRFKEKVLFQPK